MTGSAFSYLVAVAGLAAVVFLLAAAAQAVSGFGSALVAVPLLAIAIGPERAVVAATAVSLLLTAIAWRRERSHVDVPVARRLTLAGVIGMPLGLLVLTRTDPHRLSLLIGGGLLVVVVLMAAKLRLPSGLPTQLGGGVASGVMLTSTGMNGPALVMTLDGLRMGARANRATLQAVFCGQDLIGVLAFLALGYADPVTGIAVLGGCLGVPLGWRVGDRVFHRLKAETFRRIVLVGLFVTGIVALTTAPH